MPEAAKNQSPAKLNILINRKPMTAPMGNFLTVTPGTDVTAVEICLDGSVVFCDIAEGFFRVKIAISPTSDTNDVLQDALDSGKFFAFDARDQDGRMVVTTPQTRIEKKPELKWADKIQANEWSLICVGKYQARGSKPAV